MLFLSFILAQAKSPVNANLINIAFIVLLVVVMYFFMIRPQQKKQKDQKNFVEALKRGDRVITIGGLHGKIAELDSKTITIEVDNKGTKLTFERSAISLENTKANYGKDKEAKA